MDRARSVNRDPKAEIELKDKHLQKGVISIDFSNTYHRHGTAKENTTNCST